MTDRLRQMIISASNHGIPAWVSDDREHVVLRLAVGDDGEYEDTPVYNMRDLRDILGFC